MKKVKIFSKSNHSDLEDELNDYLYNLPHSYIVKDISYNFPKQTGELWSAVVEIDFLGGKTAFWATDNKSLAEAINMYGDEEKAPFVVRIPDGCTKVEREAFKDNKNIGIVMFPNSLTRIEDQAFWGCHSLSHIYIPSSVEYIGVGAFSDCYNLSELVIPKSVTKIKGSIANGVSTIKVDHDNPEYDSRNDCNAIIETSTNTLISGCCNTKIPDTVTKIAVGAFLNCTELFSIKIPNSVCEIEMNAFDTCRSLHSIRIPDSISRIEQYVFINCDHLSTIYIPNSVKYIDSCAFGGNRYKIQNTHIEILDPNKVQFGDNNDCFDFDKENGMQCRLWVPKGTKSMYEKHPAFKEFDIIVEDK